MSLRIIKAGVLDTVQDSGRFGYGALGVNPGGVADGLSAALANVLLGKDETEPVLELHFPAPTILFTQPTVICITGAQFGPCINEVPIPYNTPVLVAANSVLTFTNNRKGQRCYLAVLHALQVQLWLGSYSTHIKAGVGGYRGRALKKGDELIFDKSLQLPAVAHNNSTVLHWHAEPEKTEDNIAIMHGPEWEALTQESKKVLLQQPFYVNAASDRMALLLAGVQLQASRTDIVSSPVTYGTMQLLPSGALAILMADHQTTGGYPRIAQVAAACLPALAQATAGTALHFCFWSIEEAEAALKKQILWLHTVQHSSMFKMKNFLQYGRIA